MKWEDIEVMRIYMKSGAVFQYYDFTGFASDPSKFADRILSTKDKNISITSLQSTQIIKMSEIESIEFEVKHGS